MPQANKSGMLDDEAEEEEEEEETIRGLGDFGFTNVTNPTSSKEPKEDEQSGGELDEDDLEHIVDELSDNEGDQEAAEKARLQNDLETEKNALREVVAAFVLLGMSVGMYRSRHSPSSLSARAGDSASKRRIRRSSWW